jgi:hypothetical protein
VLKISYETTDRICVHHAEQVRLRSFERDQIQGLRAYAQDTVLRKTRIDVLYAKQPYEPFSWKSCPLTPPLWHPWIPSRARQGNTESWHLTAIYIYTVTDLLSTPTDRYETAPLASTNTPTNPPGNTRAGT